MVTICGNTIIAHNKSKQLVVGLMLYSMIEEIMQDELYLLCEATPEEVELFNKWLDWCLYCEKAEEDYQETIALLRLTYW